jgi:hypothetical protein
MQQNFPVGPPYVLTHADLNLGNILVHEGKIVAIIDWELAGYYPWWVEIFTSHSRSIGDSGHELFDAVWKELGTSLDDIWDKIHPVSDAWRYCPVQHTGKTHYWLRPAFASVSRSAARLTNVGLILRRGISSIMISVGGRGKWMLE